MITPGLWPNSKLEIRREIVMDWLGPANLVATVNELRNPDVDAFDRQVAYGALREIGPATLGQWAALLRELIDDREFHQRLRKLLNRAGLYGVLAEPPA